MEEIVIREATENDAEQLIEYTKIIGGETDNLTYGAEGLPITVEQEKASCKKSVRISIAYFTVPGKIRF